MKFLFLFLESSSFLISPCLQVNEKSKVLEGRQAELASTKERANQLQEEVLQQKQSLQVCRDESGDVK